MYKIIGVDRREYGPVNADQILKWIAEGRANAQTRARREDSPDWKALAEFPEFAATLTAKAPPPTVPPLVVTSRPVPSSSAFRIGDCFSRAWELYQSKFILCFGATAIILLLGIGLVSIHAIGALVEAALGFVLLGGLTSAFLRLVRGEPADVGDAFVGFKASFVPLVLGSLVAHVLTAVGLALLVLPGIYLLVAWWMFVPLLIIDRKLDFWPAMELSRKTVNRNWWPCLGLFLLSALVAFGGFLVCVVGLFFTLPISLLAVVCAYERLFGASQEQTAAITNEPSAPVPGETPVAAPAPVVPDSTLTPAAPAPKGDPTMTSTDPTATGPEEPSEGTSPVNPDGSK